MMDHSIPSLSVLHGGASGTSWLYFNNFSNKNVFISFSLLIIKSSTSLGHIGVHEPLSPGNLVSTMLVSQEARNLVSGFASTVMKKKMEAEWGRQRAEMPP